MLLHLTSYFSICLKGKESHHRTKANLNILQTSKSFAQVLKRSFPAKTQGTQHWPSISTATCVVRQELMFPAFCGFSLCQEDHTNVKQRLLQAMRVEADRVCSRELLSHRHKGCQTTQNLYNC